MLGEKGCGRGHDQLCLPVPTCGVSLIDRPVVHLQRCVATAPREAHHVVLAVVHHGVALLDGDVVRAHVENHPHRALVLQKVRETEKEREERNGIRGGVVGGWRKGVWDLAPKNQRRGWLVDQDPSTWGSIWIPVFTL